MASKKLQHPPDRQNFQKRRTFAEGQKLMDDAHYATQRLYCDVFGFWRGCRLRACKRHRRCIGEASICLARNLPTVPRWRQVMAKKAVIAGGPRRVKPASHVELTVRESELLSVLSWVYG